MVFPGHAPHPFEPSAAQCQHVRAVATTSIDERAGNIGPVVLGEIRETLSLLLDL